MGFSPGTSSHLRATLTASVPRWVIGGLDVHYPRCQKERGHPLPSTHARTTLMPSPLSGVACSPSAENSPPPASPGEASLANQLSTQTPFPSLFVLQNVRRKNTFTSNVCPYTHHAPHTHPPTPIPERALLAGPTALTACWACILSVRHVTSFTPTVTC